MHVGAGIGIGAGIGVGTGVGSGLAAGLAGIGSMASAAMGFRTKNSEEVEERSSGRGAADSPRDAIRISSNADSSFVSELPTATLRDPANEANSVGGFSLGLSDSLSDDERSSDDEYMSELFQGGGTRSMDHDIDDQGKGRKERKEEDEDDEDDDEGKNERVEEGHVADGVDKSGHEAERQTFSDGDGPPSDGGGERSEGSGYASDGVATPGRRASVRREQQQKVCGPRRGNETRRFRGKPRSLGSSGGIAGSLESPSLLPPTLMRRAITTETAKPKVNKPLFKSLQTQHFEHLKLIRIIRLHLPTR